MTMKTGSDAEKACLMDGPLPPGLNEAWERFFATGQADVFADPLLFPLQRRAEAERMVEIARGVNPRVVMSIGCDKGPDLLWWCSIPSVRDIVACEIRGTPYSAAFEKQFSRTDFLWLAQSSYSQETVDQVREWLGRNRIDAVFIDGDKCFMDRDFLAYLPMMSDRAVAFVHDITDEAPRECYDRILAHGFKHEEIILRDEWKQVPEEPTIQHHHWLRFWSGRSAGVGVVYIGEKT